MNFATGYGALIGGILKLNTIRGTKNEAAMCALWIASGGKMTVACENPEICDCAIGILGGEFPDVKLVHVSVQVAQ